MLIELKLARLRKPTVIIEFVKQSECFGFCCGDRDGVTITISKTHPQTGRALSFMEMMWTLSHEMVHAKQFLRGELIADPEWRWKGRSAKNYKYANQPWEREAYRLESVLFYSCFPIASPFIN